MKNQPKNCQFCSKLFHDKNNVSRPNWAERKYCSSKCCAHGRPMREVESLFMAFHKRVKITDGCWEWSGPKNIQGYGVFRNATKFYFAHRICYIKYKGEIKDGNEILHSCDNPGCVNPYHLEQGTHQQNIQDMFKRKRRNSQGIHNPKCKLSNDDILNIRKKYKEGMFQREIAELYNIKQNHVSGIVRKERWSHI